MYRFAFGAMKEWSNTNCGNQRSRKTWSDLEVTSNHACDNLQCDFACSTTLHPCTYKVVLVVRANLGPDHVQILLFAMRKDVLDQVFQHRPKKPLPATEVTSVHHVGEVGQDSHPRQPEHWVPIWMVCPPILIPPNVCSPTSSGGNVCPWLVSILCVSSAANARLSARILP